MGRLIFSPLFENRLPAVHGPEGTARLLNVEALLAHALFVHIILVCSLTLTVPIVDRETSPSMAVCLFARQGTGRESRDIGDISCDALEFCL